MSWSSITSSAPHRIRLEDMRAKDVVKTWVAAFNRADVAALADLYQQDAINHQVANEPVEGREAIRELFAREFASAKMTCNVENLFEDGESAILWDKLTFLRQQGLPVPGIP